MKKTVELLSGEQKHTEETKDNGLLDNEHKKRGEETIQKSDSESDKANARIKSGPVLFYYKAATNQLSDLPDQLESIAQVLKKADLQQPQQPESHANSTSASGDIDKALDVYYRAAYEHVKKHHGITYDNLVARASDALANDIFSFDRPTNVSNLLLEDRLGKGVGSGKPVKY